MADNLSIFNFSKVIKKRIISIVTFIVIVYALDFVVGRTLRYLYFNERSGFQYRTTYAMDSTKADILVFGSSRANHHYVPESFEDSLKMTFYNTGRDGNGILFQTAVLKSVLKRYVPRVVILDYYGTFEKLKGNVTFDYASLLPYYRTHKEVRKIIESNSSFEKEKLISEIYPFNSQISSIIVGNLKINKKRQDDDKGYVPLYKELQAKMDTISNDKMYPVDSVKLSSFREFITTAKKAGTDVVVVYSPIFLCNKNSQEIAICNEICKNENVPFWDFSNDTLFINHRNLFHDFDHLNNTGAKLFSDIIVEKIKDNVYQIQPNGNLGKN